MWIRSFRVVNYKSFDDSGLHELSRGVNLIVGQNNAGKTSLLQALALRIGYSPHKNLGQRKDQPLNVASHVDSDFVVSGQELQDVLLLANTNVAVRVPNTMKDDVSRLFSLDEITLAGRLRASSQGGQWLASRQPSHDLPSTEHTVVLTPKPTRDGFEIGGAHAGGGDALAATALPYLAGRIYLFDAQRRPEPQSPAGSNSTLNPNASNLPEVLSTLQPNRHEYEKYVNAVRRVLPSIQWVSVFPNGNTVQIRIWNVDDKTGREDLTVSLNECGTGVGQVLAILYVVMRSTGGVICIDEPNSFLHPSASRALIGILRENASHQYVISTHSPEVVTAARPDVLFTLRQQDERTALTRTLGFDLESAREVLDEIGARLSDVFGADHVIWVEGPTEVECFPLLLKAAGKTLSAGVVFAKLANTDDLQGRHAEIIADIYRNLSGGGAIIPPAIAVSLDGDKANSKGLPALKRACGNVLRLLPRWTYENYLLHPPSIAKVLNTLPSFQALPATPEAVEAWVTNNGSRNEYGAPSYTVNSEQWLVHVNGAKLLQKLFEDLSDAKETYRKTLHSPALTRDILSDSPEQLKDLIEYVGALLEPV